MADIVQSSGLDDFSKDADQLAAKIELVKKQVDHLSSSLSSANSQFKNFSKVNNGIATHNVMMQSLGPDKVKQYVESLLREQKAKEQKAETDLVASRNRADREAGRAYHQYQQDEQRVRQSRANSQRAEAQAEAAVTRAENAKITKRKNEVAAAEQDRRIAQRKEKEQDIRVQRENRKDSKSLFSNLKTFGLSMLSTGLIIRQAVQVVRQAFETVANLGKNVGWMTTGTSANNYASIVANTANLEQARLTAAKEAASLPVSTIGAGAAGIGSEILEKLSKNVGAYKDYTNLLISSYGATANQALSGTGIGGKITDQISQLIVEDTIRQAKNFNPVMRNYSNATIMNTDFFKSLYEQNLGAYTNPNMTALRGYLSQTKGYGYAMLDLTPEQKAAYIAEMQGQLTAQGMTKEQYNDLMKQWTKAGRIIEKFGKNLYAFDEVLTNDPFSNEDVEEINRNTGDIEDKIEDFSNDTKNIGDDIIPPIDDIDKTSKELEETADSILDRLEKLKLNIKIPVDVKINIPGEEKEKEKSGGLIDLAFQRVSAAVSAASKILGTSGLPVGDKEEDTTTEPVKSPIPVPAPVPTYVAAPDKNETYSKINAVYQKLKEHALAYGAYLEFEGYTAKMKQDDAAANEYIAKIGALEQLLGSLMDLSDEDYALTFAGTAGTEFFNTLQKLSDWSDKIRDGIDSSLTWSGIQSVLEDVFSISLASAAGLNAGSLATLLGLAAPELGASTIGGAIAGIGGAANGVISTRKMPTLSTLFEEGPEMVLPLNAAGADFLATSLNNLGLSNRLTNNSANVNVNLSGINIADNDREWYEVAHKIHNIIEAEQARQGG